jgi:hypothetical protein
MGWDSKTEFCMSGILNTPHLAKYKYVHSDDFALQNHQRTQVAESKRMVAMTALTTYLWMRSPADSTTLGSPESATEIREDRSGKLLNMRYC